METRLLGPRGLSCPHWASLGAVQIGESWINDSQAERVLRTASPSRMLRNQPAGTMRKALAFILILMLGCREESTPFPAA